MVSTKWKSDKYILSYVLESPNINWVSRALKGKQCTTLTTEGRGRKDFNLAQP